MHLRGGGRLLLSPTRRGRARGAWGRSRGWKARRARGEAQPAAALLFALLERLDGVHFETAFAQPFDDEVALVEGGVVGGDRRGFDGPPATPSVRLWSGSRSRPRTRCRRSPRWGCRRGGRRCCPSTCRARRGHGRRVPSPVCSSTFRPGWHALRCASSASSSVSCWRPGWCRSSGVRRRGTRRSTASSTSATATATRWTLSSSATDAPSRG